MGTIPILSIGVATFNRHEFLKETLQSILGQSFQDFEIIVGNNYTSETLSGEILGIHDSRIRFVNHPKNLERLGNMNALLQVARGRYFTWLNDDDLYAPNFLEEALQALQSQSFPVCLFSGYRFFSEKDPWKNVAVQGELKTYSGPQFLERYLRKELPLMGCYGVLDREYLKSIGGMKSLGEGPGLYSDILIAIRAGLLEKVLYLDAPYVGFRDHPASLSNNSTNLSLYCNLQRGLFEECEHIFSESRLAPRSRFYASLLLRWILEDAVNVATRARKITPAQVLAYVGLIAEIFAFLGASSFSLRGTWLVTKKSLRLLWNLVA